MFETRAFRVGIMIGNAVWGEFSQGLIIHFRTSSMFPLFSFITHNQRRKLHRVIQRQIIK